MIATFQQAQSSLTSVAPDVAPVFAVGVEHELVRRWGAIFSVFGPDLDEVLEGMVKAVPGGQGMESEVYAAANRYSALLSVMGFTGGSASTHSTIYDCCDGISVLVIQQRQVGAAFERDMLASFEQSRTTCDEGVFNRILSAGICAFFRNNVPLPTGIVTVSVDGFDYLFMRAEWRDEILETLHLGSVVDVTT